jgi:hypothetical protein
LEHFTNLARKLDLVQDGIVESLDPILQFLGKVIELGGWSDVVDIDGCLVVCVCGGLVGCKRAACKGAAS